MVELEDGSNLKFFSGKSIEWDTGNLRIQSIMNNYALPVSDRVELYRQVRTEGYERNTFFYQLVQFIFGSQEKAQSAAPQPQVKNATLSDEIKKTVKDNQAEPLIEEEEIERKEPAKKDDVPLTEAYLQKMLEEAELNESGLSVYPMYHFEKHFAAGRVSTGSFTQSLLCQTYFRPYILEVVKGLIDRTIHLPVRKECIGKDYQHLCKIYIQDGYIPLGLYRNGASKIALDEPFIAFDRPSAFPFVYTNCRPGEVVGQMDLIFAIQKHRENDQVN